MESLGSLGARAKRFARKVWGPPIGTSARISRADLAEIFAAWGVGTARSMKPLSGGSSSNWAVETSGGKYVLRDAGKNADYIDFQIFVINELRARNFPYSVPQLLQAGDSYRVPYEGRFWLLYRFIDGRPLKAISVSLAAQIGRLVACYHAIARDLDCSHIGDFSLPLFDAAEADIRFRESVEHMVSHGARSRIQRLLSAAMGSILEAHHRIPAADKKQIRDLPKMPVYNDWHGHNLLHIKDALVGLVDFDSLVSAPRIVDVQNGLLYSAGTEQGIDPSKMRAFLQGYGSIVCLVPAELSLMHSLMIDRVVSLMADALAERRTTNSASKESLLVFLVNLLCWVIHNKRTFEDHLLASARVE